MIASAFLDDCRAHAKPLPGYTIRDVGSYFNVFADQKDRSNCWPCATLVYEVSGESASTPGTLSLHNVVLAYFVDPASREPQVQVWCGDAYAEGRSKERASRVGKAIQWAKAHFSSADMATLAAQLDKGYNVGKKSTGCNFWAKRAKGGYCKHVQAVMRTIDHAVIDGLSQEWAAVMDPDSVSTPAGSCDLRRELALSMFVTPVLMIGPQSAGKTHTARELAGRDPSVKFIEYGCHDGVEPTDLLGYNAPYEGGWCWKDGPVTEAFRLAQAGQRVMLSLDELLRVKARHLTPLLTAFSEFNGQYRLRSGRILSVDNGVGSEETLTADAANLGIVATTNIGGAFDIDAFDPALKSRFHIVYVDGTGDTLLAAMQSAVAAKAWPAAVVDKLTKARALTEKSAKSGVLKNALDIRALKRSVMRAATEADLADTLWAERLQCVGLDGEGRPIPEQEDHYRKVIAKVLA